MSSILINDIGIMLFLFNKMTVIRQFIFSWFCQSNLLININKNKHSIIYAYISSLFLHKYIYKYEINKILNKSYYLDLHRLLMDEVSKYILSFIKLTFLYFYVLTFSSKFTIEQPIKILKALQKINLKQYKENNDPL